MTLTIAQEFLLLAQHPEKGKFIISDLHIKYGIVGSVLFELSLDRKIEIKDNKLVIKSTKEIEDKLASEFALQLKNTTKPKKIRYWMNKFGRKSKKHKWLLLKDMEKKRIVRIEEKSFLGIFPYKLHFLTNQNLQKEMIKRLKKEVLTQKSGIDDHDLLLLGLVEACKMHKIFSSDKTELKTIKKRLKVIMAESPIAESVDKTIKEVQAAIFVSIMASTVVTTSSST